MNDHVINEHRPAPPTRLLADDRKIAPAQVAELVATLANAVAPALPGKANTIATAIGAVAGLVQGALTPKPPRKRRKRRKKGK